MNEKIKNKLSRRGKLYDDFKLQRVCWRTTWYSFSLYLDNYCGNGKTVVGSDMVLMNFHCQNGLTRKRIIVLIRRVGNFFVVMIHRRLNP
jgi:hypothetical protein